MRSSQAARRYAAALARIAREEGSWEALGGEIRRLEEALEAEPRVREALVAPQIERNQRTALALKVAAALDVSPLVKSYVRVLSVHRRLKLLPEIVSEFERLADEARGRARGTLTTARPWGDSEVERVRAQWSRVLGLEVTLEARVAPEILGGAIVRVGNVVWDGSVQGALGRLGERLLA